MQPQRNWVHWAICLVASPIILFGFRSSPVPPDSQRPILNTHPVFSPVLNPTYRDWPLTGGRGTHYVFQVPQAPTAVLFLAHGCGRSALVFWDAHGGCPLCRGLPQERAFTIAALNRGLAVIAVSSVSVCWNLHEDMRNAEAILHEWIGRQRLHLLPVVALGSSTGGWFVSRMAHRFRFEAIVLMVAEARFSGVNETMERYPPVMFVHMVKDVVRARTIRVDMEELARAKVEVAEVVCREVPVAADFFSLRIPYVDNVTSGEMVAALVAHKALTAERLMKQDARWFDWSLVLEERNLLPAQIRDHVEQELNVAFAFHEFSSLPTPEILQWLDFQVQARNFTRHS
jgi:hypothetical protein